MTPVSYGDRPAKAEQQLLIGIDVGATKIAACAGYPTGTVVSQTTHPTIREKPDDLIRQLITITNQLLCQVDESDTSHQATIGIGICGGVNRQGEVYSPIGLGWPTPVPLADMLAEATGLPVVVDNDVTAGALGEQLWGAGQGHENFAYLSVGTGIGAGLVLRGEIYRGANGWAGEIGHMSVDIYGLPCPCGNRGCVEATAGGKYLAHWVEKELREGTNRSVLTALLSQGKAVTAKEIFEAASQGDSYSQGVVTKISKHLAAVTVNIINLLDVSKIIIGGGMAQDDSVLMTALHGALQQWGPSLGRSANLVVPAGLGADAGVIGAMAVALQPSNARERSHAM